MKGDSPNCTYAIYFSTDSTYATPLCCMFPPVHPTARLLHTSFHKLPSGALAGAFLLLEVGRNRWGKQLKTVGTASDFMILWWPIRTLRRGRIARFDPWKLPKRSNRAIRQFPWIEAIESGDSATAESVLTGHHKILFVRVVSRILFLPDTWYDSAVKCLVHTCVELLIVQTPLLSFLRMFLTQLQVRRTAASDGNLWKERHLWKCLAVGCTTGDSTVVLS